MLQISDFPKVWLEGLLRDAKYREARSIRRGLIFGFDARQPCTSSPKIRWKHIFHFFFEIWKYCFIVFLKFRIYKIDLSWSQLDRSDRYRIQKAQSPQMIGDRKTFGDFVLDLGRDDFRQCARRLFEDEFICGIWKCRPFLHKPIISKRIEWILGCSTWQYYLLLRIILPSPLSQASQRRRRVT